MGRQVGKAEDSGYRDRQGGGQQAYKWARQTTVGRVVGSREAVEQGRRQGWQAGQQTRQWVGWWAAGRGTGRAVNSGQGRRQQAGWWAAGEGTGRAAGGGRRAGAAGGEPAGGEEPHSPSDGNWLGQRAVSELTKWNRIPCGKIK